MKRIAIALFVFLLAACGGSSGGSGSQTQQKQTSAETVAYNSGDFPGLSKCPESGSWDDYLKAEQAANPTQYATDKSDWEGLKAAGANDSYVSVQADSSSGCGKFGTDTPTGKVVNVYSVRFKDDASAAANFKTNSKDFHLSDSDLANIQSAGGKVEQGSATGLGSNSVVVELTVPGTSFYIAFWQNKNFEVALISYNIPAADAEAANKKINDRIQ